MRIGVALAAALAGAACFAQSSSTLTGQITDQTELIIPGVRITVAGVDNGVRSQTVSDSDGRYLFSGLPPATYTITVELEGFKKTTSRATKVDSGATVRVDLTLIPNDSRQVVEVNADPPLVETDISMVSATVTQKEIESLPIASRNVLDLALTVPGVGGDPGEDEGGIFMDVPTAGAGLIMSGGRAGSSAILADGANATSVGIGRATVTFSPDTIQEIQVIPSTFSARYGSSGGGVIQKVSRAGTNRIRGSLYWYHRNPFLHARQFNRPIEPEERRNEAGLTLSGPIVIPKLYNGRQKTFFFLSVEPKRWFDAIDIYDRFPTQAERQGDFRNSYVAPGQTRPLLYQQVRCTPSPTDCRQLVPMHRPSTTAQYPLFSANDPDPTKRGYVIPKAYFDPLVLKILEDVPLPNMDYDAQGMNYFGTRGVNGGSDRWNLKIDHNITPKNRISGRYTEVPNLADRYRVSKENLFFSYQSDRSLTRQFQFSDAWSVTPRSVNEFRAAYTYSDYSRTAPGELASFNYTKEKFGLPNATDWGYPEFRSGFGTYGLQGGSLGTYVEHQYQIADDFTLIRGRHTFSVGTDWRLLMSNAKSSGGGLRDLCCGLYDWAAAQTNSGNNNTPGGTGGWRFGAFLLGVPNTIDLRSILIPYYYRWKVGSAYIQDDFKVRRNLTLNYGVRWQYNSPRSEKFNRQAAVDFDHPVELRDAEGDLRTITFNYLYSGFGDRSIYLEPLHKLNFEPRFGFAWSPRIFGLKDRRMVLRGGYGISHSPTTGRGRDPIPDFGAGAARSWNYVRWSGNNALPRTQTVNPGFLAGIGRNIPVLRGDPFVLQIPETGVLCHNCPPRDVRVPAGALVAFSNTSASPYIQTWNLTAETQMPGNMVLSVIYMGQKGTHLYSPLIGINNPDPILYQDLLDEGIDPNEAVEDPFGREDNAGNLITTTRVNLLRPIPTAGDVNLAGLTNSNSIYHSGSISLDRRYSKGLMYRVNYTWAKSIDTTSDGNLSGGNVFLWGATRVQNAEDLRSNRAVSLFDTRHRLNFTLIWDLPLGKRRRFLKEGKLNQAAFSNWTVSALGSIVSGLPFAPYMGDANGIPNGASGAERIRPDIVPGVPLVNPRWSKNVANDVPYFNPEAFARPTFGHLGTAARTLDYARNPWKHTLNASLLRDLRPFENQRRYFQFRAEFYNILNHTTFIVPGGDTTSRIFSSAPPVCRTCLSLAGPMPYLVGLGRADFPINTRENLLAANYNQNFGKLWRDRNGKGRVIQLALKFIF